MHQRVDHPMQMTQSDRSPVPATAQPRSSTRRPLKPILALALALAVTLFVSFPVSNNLALHLFTQTYQHANTLVAELCPSSALSPANFETPAGSPRPSPRTAFSSG